MNTRELITQHLLRASGFYIEGIKEMTFEHVGSLLGTKGAEYSSDVNRFENFLEGAKEDNITPEEQLRRMMKKHTLSVKKFIKEVETGKRRPVAQWDEKIDDIITYMILLKAITCKRAEVEEAWRESMGQIKKEKVDHMPNIILSHPDREIKIEVVDEPDRNKHGERTGMSPDEFKKITKGRFT